MSVQILLPVLNQKEIFLNGYRILVSDNKILEFNKSPATSIHHYELGDQKIDSSYLLSLAGVFRFEINPQSISSNFDSRNHKLKKQFYQRIIVQKIAVVSISILLILLMVNYFFYTRYYEQFQKLTEKNQFNLAQQTSGQQLKKTVDKKLKTIQAIQQNYNSNSSLLLNKIVVSMPKTIILEEYIFQPLNKGIKKGEPISLDHQKIIISGETSNDLDFSNWIKTLQNVTDSSEITVDHFGYKSKGINKFSLTLQLKEDE